MTLEQAIARAHELFDEWKDDQEQEDDIWISIGDFKEEDRSRTQPKEGCWDVNLFRDPDEARPCLSLYPDWILSLPEPVYQYPAAAH